MTPAGAIRFLISEAQRCRRLHVPGETFLEAAHCMVDHISTDSMGPFAWREFLEAEKELRILTHREPKV